MASGDADSKGRVCDTIRIWKNPRREAEDAAACRMLFSGFTCSRRRITLATLLASCSRSMPCRSLYWLRCSREQKSPSDPTQIRLSGLLQSWQLRALIQGNYILA